MQQIVDIFFHTGHGIFLQTPVGQTLINVTDITDNWGDGVKMYISNRTIRNFNQNFKTLASFCRQPAGTYPSYPMLQHENIIDFYGNKPHGYKCGKVGIDSEVNIGICEGVVQPFTF